MHVDIETKGLLDEKIILGYAEHDQDWLEHVNFVFLSWPTIDSSLQQNMVVTSI